MKRSHLVLIITAVILALSSAYSLAAINQVYKLNFEWYSQYNGTYLVEARDASRDRWLLPQYPKTMHFCVLTDRNAAVYREMMSSLENSGISNADLGKYVLVCSTLGRQPSPEYRIKVVNIAQRGATVEIIVSLNSPEKLNELLQGGNRYFPSDVVRIKRSSFPNGGRLYFIIKNQDGIKLYDQFCDI